MNNDGRTATMYVPYAVDICPILLLSFPILRHMGGRTTNSVRDRFVETVFPTFKCNFHESRFFIFNDTN